MCHFKQGCFAVTFLMITVIASDAQPLTKARILPLEPADWTDSHREILRPTEQSTAVFTTCLRNAELCRTWMPFTRYLLSASSLTPRDRELLIMRTGWLCRSEYEWGHHVVGAKRAGLTDEEIARIAKAPDAPGWSESDTLLLRAADELHKDQFISDVTWNALATRYSQQQMMDVTFTVGQYTMLSMFLKSAGVQLEPGVATLPK